MVTIWTDRDVIHVLAGDPTEPGAVVTGPSTPPACISLGGRQLLASEILAGRRSRSGSDPRR
jgi:hypothetical protein